MAALPYKRSQQAGSSHGRGITGRCFPPLKNGSHARTPRLSPKLTSSMFSMAILKIFLQKKG